MRPTAEIPYDPLFAELSPNEDVRSLLEQFRGAKSNFEDRCEREASSHQRWYKATTLLAGVFGTLAVMLAIVQLSGRFHWEVFFVGEVIAVVVALLAVGFGVIASQHHSWLLHRHKAERCHFVYWELLIDPRLWDRRNPDVQRGLVQRAIARLEEIDSKRYKFQHWLEQAEPPTLPPRGAVPPPSSLRDLYLAHRLDHQRDYFARTLAKNARLQRWTHPVALVAFLLSVLAALLHFGIDIGCHLAHDEEALLCQVHTKFNFGLLMAAAQIPVLAGLVRIFRGAFEPARNLARYDANRGVLASLSQRLKGASDEDLAGELWLGEHLLESEHREWLLLMMEAEWFG